MRGGSAAIRAATASQSARDEVGAAGDAPLLGLAAQLLDEVEGRLHAARRR